MLFFALSAALAWYVSDLTRDAPDLSAALDYQPPTVTRVLASDGRVIAEYARERREPVGLADIPVDVRNAFIAAEDRNFERHQGIDYVGIVRAVGQNVAALRSGRRAVGASTITQQVVKNVLVGSDRTLDRKVTEAMLAWELEEERGKDDILEIYLNEVYFGLGAYGIAEAARRYFDKPVGELTLNEAAYLAALPKAPANYHPHNETARAVDRRNWVLDRMAVAGFIDEEIAAANRAKPLGVAMAADPAIHDAGHFTGEVRRRLVARYGAEVTDTAGLVVHTSLDADLQAAAHRVLLKGLSDFDMRRGWRGPVANIAPLDDDWARQLARRRLPDDLPGWRLAVVLTVGEEEAAIGLAPRSDEETTAPLTGTLPSAHVAWARPQSAESLADMFAVGDVVHVEAVEGEAFALRQIPEVGGGIVALDPRTGRVLALVGGPSFDASPFNRATQALRQPGSSFKPIVYATALELGYTPASVIVDAPIAIALPDGDVWQPENYRRAFYGPRTLRQGVEHSLNVMTVRLAQMLGFETVRDYAEAFGLYDDIGAVPALALGAGETSLLRMASAYATFPNGGIKVTPTLIDRVDDRNGLAILSSADRPLPAQLISAETAYQMTSIMQGVVQRGTGAAAQAVGRPIAGKTGTTNDHQDAWFIGFTPDLVVGVYVGFDEPKPMGDSQTGGRLAAPIFTDFMKVALADEPVADFAVPPGIRFWPIDQLSGQQIRPGTPGAFMEAFKETDSGRVGSGFGGFFGQSGSFLLPGISSLFGGSGALPPTAEGTGELITRTGPDGSSYSYREGSRFGTYTINGRTFTYERN